LEKVKVLRVKLRDKLEKHDLVIALGAYDALTARVYMVSERGTQTE
jgi:2-methylisocitrate lyase-like PEP mutase family enzyme